jgi:thiamine biosynthesis lipoprotein
VSAAQWPVWSTTARLVVTEPAALPEARRLVEAELAAVDAAASRFRPDSEINSLPRAAGRPQRISPLLAELVAAALSAAEQTAGDVDPTLGGALQALGYDRDFAEIATAPLRPGTAVPNGGTGPYSGPRSGPNSGPHQGGGAVRVVVRRAPAWQRIRLDGDIVTVPESVLLDLGATAKACTADRCAALVAARTGVGVLVSLGGDIATAGPGPAGGWRVLVQDRPGDPACTVTLPAGHAIATSSTVRRQWRHGGRLVHHVLDPRTCQPAEPVWRTVTVAAPRCLPANTLSTAALVRGHDALPWLRALDVPARLVDAAGGVLSTPRWPRPEGSWQ